MSIIYRGTIGRDLKIKCPGIDMGPASLHDIIGPPGAPRCIIVRKEPHSTWSGRGQRRYVAKAFSVWQVESWEILPRAVYFAATEIARFDQQGPSSQAMILAKGLQ